MSKALETYTFKGRLILPGDELPINDKDFRPVGKDVEVKTEAPKSKKPKTEG
jgi:hypothetical protein